MMPFLGIGLLLAVLTAAPGAGAVPAAGDEREGRVLIDSNESPWNAIGRLNREGGGFCTGVAIGRRTVLTAAHCLWNHRTLRWGGPQTIHFLAGYRRGAWLQHARVASYRVGDAERGGEGDGGPGPKARPSRDWAILTLSEDLGAEVTPLSLRAPDGIGARHLQAGYSRDKPHMLTVDRECRAVAAGSNTGLLTHDCDATYGDSGAPLLERRGDGGYDVIGLHIGHTRGGTVGIAISATEIASRQNGASLQ